MHLCTIQHTSSRCSLTSYLAPLSLSALTLSTLFTFLIKSINSVTRPSAHTTPPSVIAAICRNTLNCGVRPWYTRAVGEIHSEKPSRGRWRKRARRYSLESRGRGCCFEVGPGWGCRGWWECDWCDGGPAVLEKVNGWGRMRIMCARMETEPYYIHIVNTIKIYVECEG